MNHELLGIDQFGLLALLREGGGCHRVGSIRDDAILVDVVLPGQRWEIEFLLDEEPDVEVFKSDRKILGADALPGLIAKWSETPPPAGTSPGSIDETSLLRRLRDAQISFLVDELRMRRMMITGAIMVETFLPGEQWEIDVLASGEIQVERFESTHVRPFDASVLHELRSLIADRRTPLRQRKASQRFAHQIQ